MRARLYDRALAPSEIAASAASFRDLFPRARSPGASRAIDEMSEHEFSPRSSGYALRLLQIREPTRLHRKSRARRMSRYGEIPHEPGKIVKPVGIAAIVAPDVDFGLEPDAPEARRRERLAAWICGSQNPLFARVVVNRLWQAHFGAGFVETASDFGFNGGKPSHPELLDWLSSEIVRRRLAA